MKLNFHLSFLIWIEFLHMVYLNFGKGFDKNLNNKSVNTKMKGELVVLGGFEDGWNAYSKSYQ